MRRLLLLVVLPVSMAVAGAAPALAATAVAVDGGVLTITAAPGETNSIRLSHPHEYEDEGRRGKFLVSDRVDVVAGPGCEGPSGAKCSADGIAEVRILAGDGDDRIDIDSIRLDAARVPVHAFGGDGDDRLGGGSTPRVNLHGEGGDDRLSGGDQGFSRGGAGNDEIIASTGTVDGGDGDDFISVESGEGVGVAEVTCGAGFDRVLRDKEDRFANDCEELRGLDFGALPCRPRCIPDRSWRIRVRLGDDITAVDDPPGARRSAAGTIHLRTWFKVTPRGGGARRHVRLGRSVPFSIREGRIATVKYRLNAAARHLLRKRPDSAPFLKTAVIIVTRNENGFKQRELGVKTIGICHGIRCRATERRASS